MRVCGRLFDQLQQHQPDRLWLRRADCRREAPDCAPRMAAGEIEDCALVSGAAQTQCLAARDMNYLFWDPDLEALDTFWAHQCIRVHHSTWNSASDSGEYYLSWYAQQSILDQCDAGNCKAQGFSSGSIVEDLAASWNGGGNYESTGQSVGRQVGHCTQGTYVCCTIDQIDVRCL